MSEELAADVLHPNEDIPEEDPTKCAVCLDGEVYEGNEILFCDKCDVAVHQGCYGVKVVPDGEWYCYPCSENIDPSTLPCELCPYKGGAYKPTDKPGKWVHPLCAVWIPELYELLGVDPPTFCLAPLDLKRFRLRCVLCNKKGACVQCCYGRCTTAAHPWCVLHEPKGFTRRIVKADDGCPLWEIFCKAHASAVSDPVKPRSKRQSFSRMDDMQDSIEAVDSVPTRVSSTTANSITMTSSSPFELPNHSALAGKGCAQGSRSAKIGAEEQQGETKASSFPLLSLLEWPGISEGEGMDLDHYWNYVSSYYPEDHTPDWFSFMKSNFIKGGDWSMEHDPIFQPLHRHDLSNEDIQEQIDDILASLGSERNRAAALNYDKREELLGRAAGLVSSMESSGPTVSSTANDSTEDLKSLAIPQHSYLIEGLDYYVRKNHVGRAAKHFADYKHLPDDHTLSVLFDGPHRMRCDFAVTVNPSKSTASVVNVHAEPKNALVHEARAHVLAIESSHPPSEAVQSVAAELTALIPVPAHEQILLPGHRHVISRDEDTELNRMIHSDQRAYCDLIKSFQQKLNTLLNGIDWNNIVAKYKSFDTEDSKIHDVYMKQQTWKSVCGGLVRGVRDQSPDFNKVEYEKPPASWTIEVAGRDAPKTEEDEEVHEDSVCMCCFDGTSADNNKIIYCDGCNAPFHQICYGIGEIPEGDYFCDRCRHIQALDDDLEDIFEVKDLVKCALCPVYHGAMKPTTDGRWVHLACALWAPECEILNVAEMTDIDIRSVPMQLPRTNRMAGGLPNGLILSSIATPCIYCRIPGGHVITCDHNHAGSDGHEVKCDAAFHPLCAWFGGAFVQATCNDPTFQAKDRENIYPAGVEHCFYCLDHSISHRSLSGDGKAITEEQRTLRNKYCISIADLNQLPGKMRRKRKKQTKKKEGKTMVNQQVKDLPVDKYDHRTCAYCMLPMSKDIFNCGFDVNNLLLKPVSVDEDSHGEAATEGNVDPASLPSQTTAEAVSTSFSSSAVPFHSPQRGGGEGSQSQRPDVPAVKDELSSLQCNKCGICIHAGCAREFYGSALDFMGKNWTCYVCMYNLDFAQIKCGLCPRHGGMLYFVANQPNSYMHIYCAKQLLPNVAVSAENGIDVKSIPKEYYNKNKCTTCNRKTGICLPCKALGCNHHYHPLCGKRNKICIQSRSHGRELFCQDHIPDFVEYLALNQDGYTDYIDLVEVSKFTYTLERSRLIVDQLNRREKIKRMMCKTEIEMFSAKFHKLLDKAMHRKSSTLANDMNDVSEVLMDIDSDDDYEDSADEFEELDMNGEEIVTKFIPLDEDPRHKNVTKVTITADEEDVHEINSTWCNHRNEVRLPKKISISYAGVQANKLSLLRFSSQHAYHKHFITEMNLIKDASRKNTEIFASNKAEEKFAQSMKNYLAKQLELTPSDFVAFLQTHKLHNPAAFAQKVASDVKKPKKGYVILEDDDLHEFDDEEPVIKGDRRSSRDGRKAEAEPPKTTTPGRRGRPPKSAQAAVSSPAAPSTGRKRGRSLGSEFVEEVLEDTPSPPQSKRSRGPDREVRGVGKLMGSEDYDKIQKLMASNDYRNGFAKHFPRSSAPFDHVMQSIDSKVLLPYEKVNCFDCETCATKDQYRLERVLQDILFLIENASVPVDQDNAASSSSPAQSKGRGRRRKHPSTSTEQRQEHEVRYLAELLTDVPYADIPDYNSYVRRVVTLSSMHSALQQHLYFSVDEFFNDLYTLFNNARSVTPPSSETWKDVKKLAAMCEEWRTTAVTQPSCIQPRHKDGVAYTALTASSSAPRRGVPTLCCSHCQSQFLVENWPDKFQPKGLEVSAASRETPRRSTRGTPAKSSAADTMDSSNDADSWQWLCGECLTELGLSGQLLGARVQVWWHDDATAYRGCVTAFDEVSHCPCVLYEDGEWEFINLAVEPFAIIRV